MVSVLRGGTADEDERHKFWVDTMPCYFLFKDEISKFIDEVNRKAIRLQHLEKKSDRLERGEELSAAVDEQTKIKEWFTNELNNINNRFEKYLRLYH